MVGAGDRHLHPFGAAVPQAADPVRQCVDAAAHRLGRRARSRRATGLAGGGRRLTRKGPGFTPGPSKPRCRNPILGTHSKWRVWARRTIESKYYESFYGGLVLRLSRG